jgi:hypothetical protein
MSDTKDLNTQEAAEVGGGLSLTCSPDDLIRLTEKLTEAYDNLVDFTSYVIGRVAGDPPAQP